VSQKENQKKKTFIFTHQLVLPLKSMFDNEVAPSIIPQILNVPWEKKK
jgi:hypothetical protein